MFLQISSSLKYLEPKVKKEVFTYTFTLSLAKECELVIYWVSRSKFLWVKRLVKSCDVLYFFLCLRQEGDRIATNSAVKLSTTGLAALRRVETVREVLNQGFSHCKQRKPRSLFFHASINKLTYFSHNTICSRSVSRILRFSTWSLFLKKKYSFSLHFPLAKGWWNQYDSSPSLKKEL